ncbi:hypothetical protein AOQ88_00455 [Candidatus Riesia sp. GBBU]|nr:hypothetical protein AOQ88_00455 [Candidatus Riesia sp. GBBU]
MSFLLWRKCLIYLKKKLPISEFRTWILPLQVEIKKNFLFVHTPNRFVLDYVKKKYYNNINSVLEKVYRKNLPSLIFTIGNRIENEKIEKFNKTNKNTIYNNFFNKSIKDFSKNKKDRTYYSKINKEYTFDSLVTDRSNNFAISTTNMVLNKPGLICNPLTLYGKTGLGKTHLLHATVNKILEKYNKMKVIYTKSSKFVYEMIRSIKENKICDFRKYYCSASLLLIDDIQFFAHKKRSQEELFYIINFLLEKNRQMIFTSDRCPKEIYGISEKLQSRFRWGLIIKINSLELKTRVSILTKIANMNRIKISKKILLYIAKKLNSGIKELEGTLNHVTAYVKFTRKSVTIEFIRDLLQNFIFVHHRNVRVELIQKTVAKYFKVNLTDILSKSRSNSISYYRQISMTLIRKLTDYSFSEIGNMFGGRRYSTVIYACKKIDKLEKEDIKVKKDLFNLVRILSI